MRSKNSMERKKNFQGIKNKQTGFTLIELLVVVTILATLAGLTSVVMTGYEQDAQKQLTRVEMQRISNAIRRFKEDTGYWPKTEVRTPALAYVSEDVANFSF
jgi:prepilin-type N-terminal cleavage/methylation domain-containing protein